MTIPGSLIPQEPMSISLTVPADPPHYMLALWVMIALASFAVGFMVFIYWRQQRDRFKEWEVRNAEKNLEFIKELERKPNLNCRCTVSAEERAAATGQLDVDRETHATAELYEVHRCKACGARHINSDRCPYCELKELKELFELTMDTKKLIQSAIKDILPVALKEYWLEHKRSHQKKK